MSIKINFAGDEILTTTMSVGRTMLDAERSLRFRRYQQYVTDHAIVGLAMFI